MVKVTVVSQGPGTSMVTPVTCVVGVPSASVMDRLPRVMPLRPAASISFSSTKTSIDGPAI